MIVEKNITQLRKHNYIDAMKGLAIVGVVIVHSAQYGKGNNFPAVMQSIVANGARGVQLFFVLSAFTLFYSMNFRKNIEKYPNRNFFIRRFFRIAPLYYVGIAYYLWQDGLGARYWLGDASHISISNIISNILFVHGVNPYWITSVVPGGWAITVEMSFYCTAPFLFKRIQNFKQALNFVLISLVVRLILFAILRTFHPFIHYERLWDEYLFLYFPNQLPVFALGILMYYVIKDNHNIDFPPMTTFLIAFMLIIDFATRKQVFFPDYFMFAVSFVILGIALSTLNFRLIVNPLIMHIGRVSYSIYLMHFAVLYWLSKYGMADYIIVTDNLSAITNYLLRLSLVIVITTVMATLSSRILEKPFQNVGKLLIDKLERKAINTGEAGRDDVNFVNL
jgi:peptidoglycan/LPS O-acetylase OafA/YrhL